MKERGGGGLGRRGECGSGVGIRWLVRGDGEGRGHGAGEGQVRRKDLGWGVIVEGGSWRKVS